MRNKNFQLIAILVWVNKNRKNYWKHKYETLKQVIVIQKKKKIPACLFISMLRKPKEVREAARDQKIHQSWEL